MSRQSVLFVAQAATVTEFFSRLREAGYEASIADTLSGAMAIVRKMRPALILCQAKVGPFEASHLLSAASREEGFPDVIVFTDRATADEAAAMMDKGARDFWVGGLDWERLHAALPRAPRFLDPQDAGLPRTLGQTTSLSLRPPVAPAPPAAQPAPQPAPAKPAAQVAGDRYAIIGEHPAVRRVLALARQVAKSKATVLISGESGTGKEMFAKFLHAHSDRAKGPFIAINCAALPEHLLESELFGHEKGAFTGAIARKLGKFELASGGTILLDEISEMELGLQAKLLRVLQESEFDRVGGVETVHVDVRVLATTNRKLEQYVDEGKFRQDLYYRLNVIPLKLPSLKERGEDILLLARYFVDKYVKSYGLAPLDFSEDARQWLAQHDWPGNVRELQNLMERAVLLAGPGPITCAHFLLEGQEWPLDEPEETQAQPQTVAQSQAAPDASLPAVPDEADLGAFPDEIIALEELERLMILKSLTRTSGNRTQAAQLLGISVRTLRNKLNEYRQLGMQVP